MERGRSAFVFAGSTLFQQMVAVAISIVSARIVGASDYGALSVSRNWFVIGLVVAPLGVDIAALRILNSNAKDFSGVYLGHLRAVIFTGNALVAFAMGAGGAFVLNKYVYQVPGLPLLLSLSFASLPFAADAAILTQAFRAHGRVIQPTLISFVLQPAIRALVALGLLLSGYGAASVLIGTLIGYVAASVLLSAIYSKQVNDSGRREWSWNAIRRSTGLLRFSLWLAVSVFVYCILRNSDVLILGVFEPAKAVGVYAAVSMFAQMIQIIPQSISQTLGPRVAVAYEANDLTGVKTMLSDYIGAAALFAAPLCVGIAVFGQYLDLVFGNSFQFPALLCMNLATGYYIASVLAPTGFALSMTGSHRAETMLLAMGTLVVVGLGFPMAALLGQNGIALTVTIGFVVINVGRVRIVSKKLGLRFVSWRSWLPVGYAGAVAASVVSLGSLALPRNLLSILLMGSAYSLGVTILFWKMYFSNYSIRRWYAAGVDSL